MLLSAEESKYAKYSLDAYEEQALRFLKAADAPVLGLMGSALSSEARDAIRRYISAAPGVSSYAQNLHKYPALFSVWLAEHVMHNVGASGHLTLYPYIEHAISAPQSLVKHEREALWAAFRRALVKLGIQPLAQVNGAHYMFNEYVRQAGVPIAFADDLAVRMLRHAKSLGLPDEDDQDALMAWQSSLIQRLSSSFSVTARSAVERDSEAYYSRTFIRVHLNGGVPNPADPLELALAKAFREEGITTLRKAAIAQLSYRDGVLGVQFPATALKKTYRVEYGASSSTWTVSGEGEFRPLQMGLHRSVTISDETGAKVLSASLWEDSKSNRLLIFNADGRLRAAAQLGQESAIELPPGSYIALARFQPTNCTTTELVCDEPLLYEVQVEVKPGEELAISNGPASVTLIGQSRPHFEFIGQPKGSLERREFWFGNLKAMVDVPKEWMVDSSLSYELRLSSGDSRAISRFHIEPHGSAVVDLTTVLGALRLQPGLRRVTAELARVGDSRALQRQTILYWQGLRSVSFGLNFELFEAPANLVKAACSGVEVLDGNLRPANETARTIRLCFDVADGRLVHLTWNRPGIFVEVQSYDRNGDQVVTPKALGSLETVSLTSNKTVVVSASEPGFLCLGDLQLYVDFTRSPTKQLPASLLASHLDVGSQELRYETLGTRTSCKLLTLTHPHVVTNLSTSRTANILDVKLNLQSEAQAITLTATDITSGKQLSAEHQLVAGTWENNGSGRLQALCTPGLNGYVLHLLLDISTLGQGVWITEFGARLNGVWGHLQDANDGLVGIAIAIDDFGLEMSGRQVDEKVEGLSLPEVMDRVERLHTHYQRSWSHSCQEQQRWLSEYFIHLMKRLEGSEGEYCARLVRAGTEGPPPGTQAGYLAPLTIPSSLVAVFAQKRSYYDVIQVTEHPIPIALKSMGVFKRGMAGVWGTEVHQSLVLACDNLALVMGKGLRPKGFSLKKYVQALDGMALEDEYRLALDSYLPTRHELLGPMHLAQAYRDLERRLTVDLQHPSARKTNALALSRLVARTIRTFDSSQPSSIANHSPRITAAHSLEPSSGDTQQQVIREHVLNISHSLSLLAWYCRKEARKPGQLAFFMSQVDAIRTKEGINNTNRGCLGYYFSIAPALFSYYLLLWEFVATLEFDPIIQNG